jgi:hypothetical protein
LPARARDCETTTAPPPSLLLAGGGGLARATKPKPPSRPAHHMPTSPLHLPHPHKQQAEHQNLAPTKRTKATTTMAAAGRRRAAALAAAVFLLAATTTPTHAQQPSNNDPTKVVGSVAPGAPSAAFGAGAFAQCGGSANCNGNTPCADGPWASFSCP